MKMGMPRSQILEQVKNVVCSHLTRVPAKAFLFGSWSRGQERTSSDIDVAVEFATNDEHCRDILARIRHDLEESTIPYRVDVVCLNEADDEIVRKVREEGILWTD